MKKVKVTKLQSKLIQYDNNDRRIGPSPMGGVPTQRSYMVGPDGRMMTAEEAKGVPWFARLLGLDK